MVRCLRWSLICVGFAFGFAACGLDAIPGRNNNASNGSGAGSLGTGVLDGDASGVGDASAISNGIAGDDSGASEGENASGGASQASSGRSGGAGASQASGGRSASGGALQASSGRSSGGALQASAGRIDGGPASQASTGTGGIDSGDASRASAGGIGGAVSGRGGAAGAGGETTDTRNPLAGSAGAADATNSLLPTLFFSEYVEGSSSNKALEITAQKRIALDGCKITTYFNGKSEATVVASLTGILEAGQVLTVCSSTLKEKLDSICSQVGNLTFNGDDAVAIDCDGIILDVIGQIGIDPGAGWGTDPNTTVDHTLRRNCTGKSGIASDLLTLDLSFDPSGEWQAFPIDTFDGLGSRGC